jgi:hypothetical protein
MSERQTAGYVEMWERYMEAERRDLDIRRFLHCKRHEVSSRILHANDRYE